MCLVSVEPTILEKAELHVKTVFKRDLNSDYAYHNFDHTQQVVKAVRRLAEAANLTQEQAENLEMAAWFHDLGYCRGHENHEASGAAMAATFLRNNQYRESAVSVIEGCIAVTQVETMPDSRLEQLMCDADLSYLGTRGFFTRVERLRREWADTLDRDLNDHDWWQVNYEFLTEHRFYTPEAIRLYGKTKKGNLLQVRQLLLDSE